MKNNQVTLLLACCARVQCQSSHYDLLRTYTSQTTNWEFVVRQAEAHGLAPLFYHHLKQAHIKIPQPIKRTLQGLYLRHQHTSQIRQRLLGQILTLYQQENVPALLLKGAALANFVYPNPALRPMRDLDVLVPTHQTRQAQKLLTQLGFHAPVADDAALPSKHMALATQAIDGVLMSVEVHHNLFQSDSKDTLSWDQVTGTPHAFWVNQIPAQTLSLELLLWHLCRHAISISQSLRLIWVADIVSVAEHFASHIDWRYMQRHYPVVLAVLSHLHYLTPLSDTLRQQANLHITPPPAGIGLDFQGWPRFALANISGSWQAKVRKTVFPSPWWLGLYYGATTPHTRWWWRWIGHPWQIIRWAFQLLLERIGWRPSPQDLHFASRKFQGSPKK